MRTLELLAPAKNLSCGIAAIDHGADAVYIGAERYGARAAAGNSVEDIAELCRYAHQFGAKVYVTTNTIIYNQELEDTLQLMKDLQQVGVDAFLVQDMGIVEGVQEFKEFKGFKEGFVLHASTQTDNRTAEKVAWLRSLGFRRVVLARELSLEEIREIHRRVPDIELEVFVHGALCVSYSGLCYASQYCLGRSANRGACAQMCRMKYDLIDADGREIVHQRHLLSLKDLCQIDYLEELADAGAVSFKIEGRLKDVDYVKNVVAAYSQRLDELVRRRPNDYQRASMGQVTYHFEPDLKKTFHRGYTNYFLHAHRDANGVLQGRQPSIVSFDTPKAIGEQVGKVKVIEASRNPSVVVSSTAAFSNGDGLCFFAKNAGGVELQGFRVNKAVGNRLYLLSIPEGLRVGTLLYRNNDVAFSKLLAGKTAERKIPVTMRLEKGELWDEDSGYELVLTVDAGYVRRQVRLCMEKCEKPRKPQHDFIVKELSKLGTTQFVCSRVEVADDFDVFLTAAQLAQLRRQAIEECGTKGVERGTENEERGTENEECGMRNAERGVKNAEMPRYAEPHLYNIANRQASDFYRAQGLETVAPALELQQPSEATLMHCRHCIKFSLGYCVKHGGQHPTWREPLSLRLGDGRKFGLVFDCKACEMKLKA